MEGRGRCREMRDGEGTRTSVQGHTRTHTHAHRQRPGVSISAPTGGRENIREGPGVQETFQSFLS